MIIDYKIRDGKLKHDIKTEKAKIAALSSGKIGKYKCLTVKEVLLSDQRRVIEQAKFIYSPLGKGLKKQRKTIEDQGEKQIKTIED